MPPWSTSFASGNEVISIPAQGLAGAVPQTAKPDGRLRLPPMMSEDPLPHSIVYRTVGGHPYVAIHESWHPDWRDLRLPLPGGA